MSVWDLIVFLCYCLLVLFVGIFFSSSKKKGVEQSTDNYFLAGRDLAWWAIGSSIIASNISAEQFVGMSGSGYAIGLAVASYEWLAALGLIIVAKWFIPIFLKLNIVTMPQFLEERFDKRVKTVMALFWLAVFVFVNLTSILYLGALTINKIVGVPLIYAVVGLAAFSVAYSIKGGLKAVAITDVIQVIFLVLGGLITTAIALNYLGDGEGIIKGGANLYAKAREKFHLVLDTSHKNYKDLPGIWVILGGLWVANLYYWGCNQYIIQRALAAKSISEAQKGMVFAAIMKLFIPLLVVVPGIAAFAIDAPLSGRPDEAYPWLLDNLLPVGVKGLALAALTAAIVSSLASMTNSISTIFTMDIYGFLRTSPSSNAHLVKVGKIVGMTAMVVGVCIAPLLSSLDQAFQYIQELTGFVSPGALSIFLCGFFYKRATSKGALVSAVASVVLSIVFKVALPDFPWMNRMGLVFLICTGLIVLLGQENHKGTQISKMIQKPMFRTKKSFNLIALSITLVLIAFYVIWW